MSGQVDKTMKDGVLAVFIFVSSLVQDGGQNWYQVSITLQVGRNMAEKQNWQDWLADQRAQSQMFVEEVGLDRTRPNWAQRVVDGFNRFCNFKSEKEEDRKPIFFWFGGYRVSSAGREVEGWKQVMLREVGEGAVVLIIDEESKRFLLVAKAEPGNATKGAVLLAPTLQTSKSNLDRAHGGKCPPRAEFLDASETRWSRFCQDGGRFYHKVNQYAVVRMTDEQVGDLASNEA